MAHAGAASILSSAAGVLWSPQVKAGAEAAGATGAGFAYTLWNWNRSYYQFDVKQRWSRFVFMNKMACTQTGQYREDIEDLATATSARMDNFHIIGVMALTIATALLCPGRLGLHTPPPPSWQMGLFQTNLAGAYLWLGMTMWLAMHASLKADTAATHMLTRFVRLPVPSMKALDRARRIFSDYENQSLHDMFRIPFIMRHKNASRGNEKTEAKNVSEGVIDHDDARSRCRKDFDVPSWFKKERLIDEGRPYESLMPRTARGEAPEHFEQFRVVQCQYWPYDIYARICLFLAWMHLMSAWVPYNVGHTLQETRALWASFCVMAPLFVTQQVLITLDIVVPADHFFPWVRLGPVALLSGWIAAVIEYKRWYTDAGIYASAFFVFMAHIFTLIYTIHLFFLCRPAIDPPAAAEVAPGSAWWPAEWRLPSAWSHAIWLVAPPKTKATGECDLVAELKELAYAQDVKNHDLDTADMDPHMEELNEFKKEKAADIHDALGSHNESPAWFFVKVGLISLILGWIWLTIGYLVDVLNEGTVHPSLMNAPGLPNNLRDPRYRKPKPGYACVIGEQGMCLGQEVGTGGYYAGPVREQIHMALKTQHHTGFYRRLKSMDETTEELGEKLQQVLPHLQRVIRDREVSNYFAFGIKDQENAVPKANVKWPALFEPRLLACSPNTHTENFHVAAAISRHGRGVVIQATTDETVAQTEPFVLDSAAMHAPFLSAHWHSSGLLLSSTAGHLLECPDKPSAGRWNCHKLDTGKLPIATGSEPFAGALAVARHARKSALIAAVSFPGESSITLFQSSGTAWLPIGETRTPAQVVAASFDQKAESVLMLLADGAVTEMRLEDGAMAVSAPAFSGEPHTWQATCGLANSKVARLGVKPSGRASWEPSLLLGA
jgi:hypothetical protein